MNESWPLVRLHDLIREEREPVGKFDGDGFPVLGVTNIEGITHTGIEASADRSKYLRLRPCRFAYNPYRINVGSIGLSTSKQDGICSPAYVVFATTERIDPHYLFYFLKSDQGNQRINFCGNRGTVRSALRFDDLCKIEIPLPPLAEQCRAVARIEELNGKIREALDLRQKAMAETDALVPATATRLDQDARHIYDITTLEHFAAKTKGSLRSGPFGSALLHDEFVPIGVPAIGIQDVQENRFVLSRKWNVTDQKAAELSRYAIKPHDLLVTVMGTLGRTCVVPADAPRMVSTKHVWTITLDKQIAEPQWVSYWINYSKLVRDELLGQGTGTAIPGLNGAKLRSVKLPNIPISAQRTIVAELDSVVAEVDALRSLQAKVTAELEALLPAIFDRAFKGALV